MVFVVLHQLCKTVKYSVTSKNTEKTQDIVKQHTGESQEEQPSLGYFYIIYFWPRWEKNYEISHWCKQAEAVRHELICLFSHACLSAAAPGPEFSTVQRIYTFMSKHWSSVRSGFHATPTSFL